LEEAAMGSAADQTETEERPGADHEGEENDRCSCEEEDADDERGGFLCSEVDSGPDE
jgi:hypothetical protein